MNKAYIALGTNIEPKEVHLSEAINLLEANEGILLQKRSSVYETAPVGYTEQDDFLNMVIEIQTLLDPIELLALCQEVEMKLGRTRDIRYGPRTIDLDILLFNQENRADEKLEIPHPRMHERAFVLEPLAEIAANETVPKARKTVRELLEALPQADRKSVRKKS